MMAKQEKNKTQSISFVRTEEVALPADTTPSMGIRARDWMQIKKQVETLATGARVWELLLSNSIAVFISFLLPVLTTPGEITDWKAFFFFIAALSLGVVIVSIFGYVSQKTTWSNTKQDILKNMADIENLYNQTTSNASGGLISDSTKSHSELTEFAQSDDELYERAMSLAYEKGKISTSMLQRYLHIGYVRAARLVERLENDGIVGPLDGARPREVLIDPAD